MGDEIGLVTSQTSMMRMSVPSVAHVALARNSFAADP